MTEYQKNQIVLLRLKGFTYAKIAEKLELSINTVKSFYQRNKKQSDLICKYCGKAFIQPKGTRTKFFCSDNCRMKWWNIHGCDSKHNAVYEFKCECCGKVFEAYGNSHRKYCSRTCYITARFKGGDGNE